MSKEPKTDPLVPAESCMREFSFRAVCLGVLMAVLMGAANAYLGLKAGMTIAATYTAAVLGMAFIKWRGGTVLEENCARTVGSIGGNIATGAIFVLPAFSIASLWQPFFSLQNYLVATTILAAGGTLGIMFVTILRRVLVEEKELPFPESVAAAEIHKAGQSGTGGAKYLVSGMGIGGILAALVEFKVIAETWQKVVSLGRGAFLLHAPGMAPAYFGVGYIIGPRLGAVNFSGGLLAWGLLAPLLTYFLNYHDPAAVGDWGGEIQRVWKVFVRQIAIGGMLAGAFYTLYRMRQNLWSGIRRSFANLRTVAGGQTVESARTERDLHIRWALIVMGFLCVIMFFLFRFFAGNAPAALVAALVMLFLGFVFAAVSGYLVGIIGVSNNPTSGLTVSVLILAALLMLALGLQGTAGVAAVLGVAAFACVSVSVAGEMMQDLKAGHILGCTPWKMQVGDIFGATAASLAMFLVLSLLHLGDIKKAVGHEMDRLASTSSAPVSYKGKNPQWAGRTFSVAELRQFHPEMQNEILGTNAGFGGERLAAPQASLMAVMADGIMQRKMDLILILTGILMGFSLILMQVKSPMLISVGMYLPVTTSFAIFLGGLFKGALEKFQERRGHSSAEKDRANNTGILLASGLIAGEALIGLLFAGLAFAEVKIPRFSPSPSFLGSLAVILLLGLILVWVPLAGKKPQMKEN